MTSMSHSIQAMTSSSLGQPPSDRAQPTPLELVRSGPGEAAANAFLVGGKHVHAETPGRS
jgi:hypothetical protein